MFAQDMLALTPTLTVMGLFVYYRSSILCMWECNPQMQTMIEYAKDQIEKNLALAHEFMAKTILMANTYIQMFPERMRHGVFETLIKNTESILKIFITKMQNDSIYMLSLLAFGLLFYIATQSDFQKYEEKNKNEKPKNKILREKGPITRSMSRQAALSSLSSNTF